MFGSSDQFRNMTKGEQQEFAYNKILDAYLSTVDKWADYSLKVDAGEMSLEDMKMMFDEHIARQGMILLVLDNIRKVEKQANADKMVADFRAQLDNSPSADEPDYGI